VWWSSSSSSSEKKRLLLLLLLHAKTTETKNDDNTTNDDGKMTVTQNRTNVGLAQMRKTKQTTLVPSFPMSGKRKKDENISPRTNNPPTTNIAVKTGATTDAYAIRELWGCNWAGDDDSDDEYPFDDSGEEQKLLKKRASQPRQLLATTTIIGAKTAGTSLLRRN